MAEFSHLASMMAATYDILHEMDYGPPDRGRNDDLDKVAALVRTSRNVAKQLTDGLDKLPRHEKPSGPSGSSELYDADEELDRGLRLIYALALLTEALDEGPGFAINESLLRDHRPDRVGAEGGAGRQGVRSMMMHKPRGRAPRLPSAPL